MKPTDYRLPPESSCRVFTQPIDMGFTDARGRQVVVFLHLWEYRGNIVWFCIKVSVVDPSDGEVAVEKVDCCHGVIHRHRYDIAGDEIGEPVELRRLYLQEGAWSEVDRMYSEQSEYYFEHCADIVGRWSS